MSTDLIPFQIETHRVVQLLAKQIYQSPLALLRENTQNAFDAVLQRRDREPEFAPSIDIMLTPDKIVVADNGIGMTPAELQRHYWTAGSSSKNNAAARAAGVVGTFGIGAMANFGIAERLTVETESAVSGERTICHAHRARLSLNQKCVERSFVDTTGNPGTVVTAEAAAGEQIDVHHATTYIAEFVALLDLPVRVNGVVVSKKAISDIVSPVPRTWETREEARIIGPRMMSDVSVVLSNNADLWLHFDNIVWDSKPIPGRLVFRSGHSRIRAFHGGFGLAVASVHSAYQFGGIADLMVLEPTAGREAITAEGLQLLQSMMTEVDQFASELLTNREECNSSTAFMNWVAAHGRYELCQKLRMAISPGGQILLGDVARRSNTRQMMVYDGTDQSVIKAHASEDTPVLVLARTNPRRQCERGFLQSHASTKPISNEPVVTERRSYSDLNPAERGLAYRIELILDTDYFVKCDVSFGVISHGVPALAKKDGERVALTLNPRVQSILLLLEVFQNEYDAFGSMAKDFVRSIIFPRIADFVPSSTRHGAETFLRAIRRSEPFEYAVDDLGDLPTIWKDYDEGRITLDQAVSRSRAAVRSSVQIVESAERAEDIVPDVIENEQVLTETTEATSLDPWPGISRLEISSTAKLLVIDAERQALRGYRCFLAITDRAREEFGDFFLQPHTTSVVWGGQKTWFIFMHHSRQFGLYYDLQTQDLVDAPAGGGGCPTCSIILKDRIYIPIPQDIMASFIPDHGEKKRFDVRADILRNEGLEEHEFG